MSKKVFSAIERVTPEMAVAFLANNPSNRAINARAVDALLRQMETGQWCEHVAPIVFNQDGNLIDGQTRLSALVRYGKPIRMEIKRNVPDVVRPLIDSGRKRLASDWLQMLGYENATIMAGAARIVRAHQLDALEQYWSVPISTTETAAIVSENPSISEYAHLATCAKAGHIITASQLAGMSVLFAEKDNDLANVFCRDVGDGYEPSVYPAFHRLRETLLRARAVSKSHLSRAVVLAYCVKAWNATRRGQTMKQMRWTPGYEPFPSIL
jgi:hypothetical protein